ncbi:heterokaryon incompatibility protein-domain-containing protein [Paraphoma chrysanthemicola]|uniref:Heterokaryon incompatibility protein-domain-containing protein n=1 Tax=Paraphoma chrysanthemicola TaxID=798071 RepID=A0A8K0R900_9PLEO|nr:heterokaryon incompatibility protein-domain-containing protein [Paraphoma chrysanthemicola]
MFLIDTTTLLLREFPNSDQRYAILSHTWGCSSDEVTYEEMVAPERSAMTQAKPGYAKVVKTCDIARTEYNLPYAWIDTCCINKSSSAELSESINSMFRWYHNAGVCLAYLSDVGDGQVTFSESRWFTRGWTLQELIAPKDLVFLNCKWEFLGTRGAKAAEISTITRIPTQVLNHTHELSDIPIAQRFSWASTRETTRVEDCAYSLLGIFDINMPMLYGEGRKAFVRLQEHILSQSDDMSLFLWNDLQASQEYTGLLAPSPGCFHEMHDVTAEPTFTQRDYQLTNRGIRLKVGLAWDVETGLAVLPVNHSLRLKFGSNREPAGIYLRRVGLDLFARARPQECAAIETSTRHTDFTAVRTLAKAQSAMIEATVIKVSVSSDISIVKVEPKGSYNPKEQVLHAGHTGAFIGFMKFEFGFYSQPFTVVFCFKGLHWFATVVHGQRWYALQDKFYSYYKDHLDEINNDDTVESTTIGRIYGVGGGSVVVHMRGGINPTIDVRTTPSWIPYAEVRSCQ